MTDRKDCPYCNDGKNESGRPEHGPFYAQMEKRMETNLERPVFVTALLAAIENFDENLFPPQAEVRKGETVLGEVSPWVRKAYAYARMCDREIDQLQLDMKYDSHEHSKCARVSELEDISQAVNKMVWGSVNEQFKQAGTEGWTGLRKGWVVIHRESSPTAKRMGRFEIRGLKSGSPEEFMERLKELFGEEGDE